MSRIRKDRKLPFPPVPFEDWPEDLRQDFQRLTQTAWKTRAQNVKAARKALADWLGWADRQGLKGALPRTLTPDTLSRYEAALSAHLALSSVYRYFGQLQIVVTAVAPAHDWTALLAATRDLYRRVQATRSPAPRLKPERAPLPCLRAARAAWPPEIREAWAALVEDPRGAQGKRYRDRRPAARWTRAYRKRVERGLGLFIGFCQERGRAVELTPDTLGDFLDACDTRGVSEITIATYAYETVRAFQILQPGRSWQWALAFANELRATARPSKRAEKLARLVTTNDLFRLGCRLMDGARTKAPTRTTATQYRDGLMIAVLARRPVRMRNFTETVLESATATTGRGALILERDAARLFYPSTKNKRPYSAALDRELVPYLQGYVDTYRPILLGDGPTTDAMWIGKRGGPLGPGGIAQAITSRTAAAFGSGRRINPHLFRHALATSLGDIAPAYVKTLAPAALGTVDATVLSMHYDLAGSAGAMRVLEEATQPYLIPPPAKRKPVHRVDEPWDGEVRVPGPGHPVGPE